MTSIQLTATRAISAIPLGSIATAMAKASQPKDALIGLVDELLDLAAVAAKVRPQSTDGRREWAWVENTDSGCFHQVVVGPSTADGALHPNLWRTACGWRFGTALHHRVVEEKEAFRRCEEDQEQCTKFCRTCSPEMADLLKANRELKSLSTDEAG